jgi:hypothetical protein
MPPRSAAPSISEPPASSHEILRMITPVIGGRPQRDQGRSTSWQSTRLVVVSGSLALAAHLSLDGPPKPSQDHPREGNCGYQNADKNRFFIHGGMALWH